MTATPAAMSAVHVHPQSSDRRHLIHPLTRRRAPRAARPTNSCSWDGNIANAAARSCSLARSATTASSRLVIAEVTRSVGLAVLKNCSGVVRQKPVHERRSQFDKAPRETPYALDASTDASIDANKSLIEPVVCGVRTLQAQYVCDESVTSQHVTEEHFALRIN